jgi:circadian clock protein KaiB
VKRPPTYHFRLFVAGLTHNSVQAVANLNAICLRLLPDRHVIDVIDVFDEPRRALADAVFMTTTLIQVSPYPRQRIVGTLSDADVVVRAMGLDPVHA